MSYPLTDGANRLLAPPFAGSGIVASSDRCLVTSFVATVTCRLGDIYKIHGHCSHTLTDLLRTCSPVATPPPRWDPPSVFLEGGVRGYLLAGGARSCRLLGPWRLLAAGF